MNGRSRTRVLLVPGELPPRRSSIKRLLLYFDEVLIPDAKDRAFTDDGEIDESFPGSTISQIVKGARELRLDDRAALAEKLQRSLEGISEAENERLWLAESERRLLEIQSGQVEALPGEEVLRRAVAEIS